MTVLARFVAALVLAVMWPVAVSGQSGAEALFREGLLMERAEGRLRDAIFRYERVVAEFPADHAVVVQALRQLALAYEKLGDPRARVMWSRLATGAENPFTAEARRKVDAAQTAESSGPFAMRVLDPSFELGSPDGRLVVFYQTQNQPGRLMLRDLSTGAERLLLDTDGIASNFAWSPDSRELAFNFNVIRDGRRLNEIRIVTAANGNVRSVGVQIGFPFVWTSRGDIFFYRPNYAESAIELWTVPASGGEARKVYAENMNDSCNWAISADGRSIIGCRGKRLIVRDVTSGAEQQITAGSGEERGPVLSPDGRLVAFWSNEDGAWGFYVAPLDRLPVSRPLRLARIDPSTAADRRAHWWTQNGLLTIRSAHADSNIYRLDMDVRTGRATDSPRRLTQDAPVNTLASVNPDGTRIAYFYRSGVKSGIAVMDAMGLNERPLLEQGATQTLFWRSPDELLFRNFDAASATSAAIASLNLTTGLTTEVAKVEGLYWRPVPARREILHVYPKGGGWLPGAVLKAFSIADGRDRTVAAIDFFSPAFTVSPDGRRIAYAIAPDGSTANGCAVSLMTIDGKPEKALVPVSRACPVPASDGWSPDGKYLLVNGGGPRIVNVETGESRVLHAEVTGQEWTANSWAADGSFVTLTRSATRIERHAWEGVTYEAVAANLPR